MSGDYISNCGIAIKSIQRAAEACQRASGAERRAELAAIGYGKLLAYYGLGLLEDADFNLWRRFFGY